jgi:hypothetical protein
MTVKRFAQYFMFCEQASSGKFCLAVLALLARCMIGFSNDLRRVCLKIFGVALFCGLMSKKAYAGALKHLMVRLLRRLWVVKLRGIIGLIDSKRGTKRSLLVKGNGVPVSLVVDGANVYDVTLAEDTLVGVVARRPKCAVGSVWHFRGQ